ncbi:hypothetical protein BgiMline_033881, partial [Biomphalaria glabrata]
MDETASVNIALFSLCGESVSNIRCKSFTVLIVSLFWKGLNRKQRREQRKGIIITWELLWCREHCS